jgi:hypothetical protein
MKIFKGIKRGQKYIVVCTNPISRSRAGLGSSGRFSRDTFVTSNGSPTVDPNDLRHPAQVYVRGVEDFPFDHDVQSTVGSLANFFAPVRVSVRIEMA